MVTTSDETRIQILANWPMSHAKRVTRDNWKNPEYHVIAALRNLRTDTNCPAGKSWPNADFSIRSRAHVRLTCLKHFMIVRKLANASPGLKSIRFITFSSIKMFFLLYFVFIKLQTGNLTAKLQNSNQNCTFSWVNSLIGFSTTWPRSYAFRLA